MTIHLIYVPIVLFLFFVLLTTISQYTKSEEFMWLLAFLALILFYINIIFYGIIAIIWLLNNIQFQFN